MPPLTFFLKTSARLLAGTSLCLLFGPAAVSGDSLVCEPAHAEVEAEFRGCDSAGCCRFWFEPTRPTEDPLHRLCPDGVVRAPADHSISVAVRDRLNALLASMIHQNKQIVLHDLRQLDDGTYAAAVTVNGEDVASDTILLELRKQLSDPSR